MKKHPYLCAAAASLLLASVLLTSCGAQTAPADDGVQTAPAVTEAAESAAENSGVPVDGIADVDMDGYTVNILNQPAEWLTWANLTIIAEQDGDVLNDAIYNRNMKLSERFNCDLHADESDQVQATMQKNVTAGDPVYDVYVCNEGAMNGFLPYALDWNNIPDLRLDEPWWNPMATSVYNVRGKQTALAGYMTLSAVSRSVCMVFNKDIWASYGDPEIDLYGLVDDNEWTVDKYLEVVQMVKKDLDGNGVMDVNDLYGLNMGRGFKGYIASFLTGSGMNFTEKNSDGENVFTLHENERALGMVIRLVDMLGTEGYSYNEDTTCHGFLPADFFKNGHALFTQGVPHDIYKLRDMENDIGILPMPKYDAAQDGYHSAAWGGAVWTLSRAFDLSNADCLGTILDAMAFDTYYNIVPVYKEIALKTKTARDAESAEMLDIIFDSISFDFGTNIMYDSVYAVTFLTDIWQKKSSDVIVSSIEKAMGKIGDAERTFFEAVDALE